MSRQTTILIIVLVFLSFIFGLGAGLQIGGGKKNSNKNAKSGGNTYQAGWDAAKKRLADSEFYPMMPGGMEIKTISGEVIAVKDNKIAVKARPLEPLADPNLDARIVVSDSNTKIYQMEQRDREIVQKEMEEFQKAIQERMKNPAAADTAPITPPATFTKKEIKISDIKAGQQITVSSDADVKNAKEIKATEITVRPSM